MPFKAPPGPSDADLAALVRAGDRDAADLLLARHEKLVWRCVHKLKLPEWVDRDDIAQAGFLALWRAAEKWSPDRGSKFSTYAHAAVWHAVANAARAEQKLLSVDDKPLGADGPTGLDELVSPEPAEPPDGIREWVEGLPPTHRRLVELRYGLDGEPRNWREAGEAVGVSQSDAKRMCGNAVAMM